MQLRFVKIEQSILKPFHREIKLPNKLKVDGNPRSMPDSSNDTKGIERLQFTVARSFTEYHARATGNGNSVEITNTVYVTGSIKRRMKRRRKGFHSRRIFPGLAGDLTVLFAAYLSAGLFAR